MKTLVIFAHPDMDSLVGSLYTMVLHELKMAGHDVRTHNLYNENFNPVMSAYERQNHSTALAPKLELLPELRPYVEDLQWCNSLILVYPTWWSGQPAILKGWFDRLLVNEVAWELPAGSNRIRPRLTNIRKLVVVTTHGSNKLINSLQGESGKRIAFRAVRLMFHWRTKCVWIGTYGLDVLSISRREKAISKAQRRFRRWAK